MRFFLFCLLILALTQCTIEKRLYNKGFHVEWRKRINHSSRQVESNSENKDLAIQFSEDTIDVKNIEDPVIIIEQKNEVDETESCEKSNIENSDKPTEKPIIHEDPESQQASSGKEWLSIFPTLMIIASTILPYISMNKEILLLLYIAIGLAILGHFLFLLLKKDMQHSEGKYAKVVSFFYNFSFTFSIVGSFFFLVYHWAIKGLSYNAFFEIFDPNFLILCWVWFALLAISLTKQLIAANRGAELTKEFTVKMIMAVILFTICVVKTILII